MLNSILMIVSAIAMVLVLFSMYQKSKLQSVYIEEEDFSSIDKVVEAVKIEMVEIIKEDYSLGLSESEFNALYKRKARIQEALRSCVFGIDSAKIIVIELIRTFIEDNISIEKIEELLGIAEGQEPSDHVKFEIIMYKYKQEHGKKALGEWMKKNKFANERIADDTDNDLSYYVTVEDLYMSYDEEGIVLKDEEKIDMLAILVYQLYKGFGIVDTLREMDINGFNMGTSGSILTNINKQKEGIMQATNAVWLYFNGKYIHLRFMNYGSEEELKRIVQLLVRYNNPGPLTAKRGYLVNTMYDKSRILALRPPASEYWAIFVRKFTLTDLSPEFLIAKEYTKRADLPIRLIEYLMRGQITCAVSGRQGSGKTTMMSAIIRYIDPRHTIRVLEMAPELYLRELYPTRNILSVQETTTVTAEELQDALKKSDAAVSIVGEVATDIIAARMIQMGMTASLFTVFSHHANTARDLVFTIRNSLVNAGGFSNMDTAERQVTEVIKCDIHLDYTADGKRYIERISEIIPMDEKIPYPELNKENLDGSMAEITKEYYERKTDRLSFWTHDILKYDLDNHTYYAVDRLSPALESKLRGNLSKEKRLEYDKFTFANWGKRTNPEFDERDEVADTLLEYAKISNLEKDLIKVESDEVVEVQDDFIIKFKHLETAETEAEIDTGNEEDSFGTITQEDEDDVALFFDFFDGEVDV